jgi:hypothetical protein
LPRYSPALAHDAVRKQLVLFGGGTGTYGTLGDTWVWNGSSWRQQHPSSSPPPRVNAHMTFDVAHGVMVLFGGGPSGGLEDTWTWDGSNWTEQHPDSTPAGYAVAMDYDAALGQVVAVFGQNNVGPHTWAWDGTTWHQFLTSHTPDGLSNAMAYDPVAKQMVLLAYQGTWTFDGVTWSQAAAAGDLRALPTMAYDATTRSMVVFNGGATWTWDGAGWTQRCPPTAPPVLHSTGPQPAMAYDAAAGLVILFGGVLPSNDASSATWTWDGTTWAQWHAKS